MIIIIKMIAQILFSIYFIIFELITIWLGLNFTRIREKHGVHPRIPSFIMPLFLNYFLGNYVFTSIPTIFSVLLPCVLNFIITLKFEKVRILGLTGSIATGKSTLTRLIRDNFKDIHIIDCDQISRKLRKKGQPGYKLIVELLGDKAEEYLNPLTQQIQEEERKKLNEFVFKNKQFRSKLTKKMGQLIIMRVFKTILVNILTGKNHMLVDAPLLYETKILTYVCFPIIVVGCSEQTQISRLMKRDGYTEEQAKTRIASQMPLIQKIKRAEIYLSNEGTESVLLQQFSSRIKRYLSEKMTKAYVVEPRFSQQKKSELRRQAQSQ